MPRQQLSARWICPISGPPIPNGSVVIQGPVIQAISASGSGPDVEHLEDAVILPGLINAHTHLELAHLAGRVPPGGELVHWLQRVVEFRRADPDPDLTAHATALAAAASSLRHGVTTVGDITRYAAATRRALAGGPLNVLSFAELIGIGPSRHQVASELPTVRDRGCETDRLTVGLSPHAPYSVAKEAVADIAAAARADGLRLCMHLAESLAEAQFVREGTGPFAELLDQLGLAEGLDSPSGLSPVQWAETAGLLGPDCILAHANHLDDEDIAVLCRTGTHVAYCPRTHAAFNSTPHPWIRLLGAGVNVCVATDSLASSPSLCVLEELASIAADSQLSFDTLLEMVTLNPARALGCAQSVGTLAPGKRADLAVFACDDDPEDALLGDDRRLLRLYVHGQRVL